MKRFLFTLLALLVASVVEAQTCNRTGPGAQTCTFNLSWAAPAVDATHDAATQYIVQRKDGAGSFADIATVNAPTLAYTDSIANDPGNVQRCYQVVSANAVGRDGPSNGVCKTTPAVPALIPNPPTNFQVSALSQSEIRLNWRDRSDNEDGFLARRDGDGQTVTLDIANANATTAIDTGLKRRTRYCYEIAAFNGAGVSNWSRRDCTRTASR